MYLIKNVFHLVVCRSTIQHRVRMRGRISVCLKSGRPLTLLSTHQRFWFSQFLQQTSLDQSRIWRLSSCLFLQKVRLCPRVSPPEPADFCALDWYFPPISFKLKRRSPSFSQPNVGRYGSASHTTLGKHPSLHKLSTLLLSWHFIIHQQIFRVFYLKYCLIWVTR